MGRNFRYSFADEVSDEISMLSNNITKIMFLVDGCHFESDDVIEIYFN